MLVLVSYSKDNPIKWYLVDFNNVYVYSLGMKNSDGAYLCMEYHKSERVFYLGWWDLSMMELKDAWDLNISINTHEWILMIFTDDIEVE